MDIQKKLETARILVLLDCKKMTKTKLADDLGMTRVTLDARLKLSNWGKLEMIALNEIK